MKKNKILLIYPRTNKHLGLWEDLTTDPRVILRSADTKSKCCFVRLIRRILCKIYRNKELPINHVWFEYSDIFKLIPQCSRLVIIDGSLNQISISELKKCKRLNPDLKICLYLINSIGAQSPILRGFRRKYSQFNWDDIYTFDQKDAIEYGFTYAGFMYYSKHRFIPITNPKIDAYFVGGLKGNRTENIGNVYSYLTSQGVVCDFNLMYSTDIVKENLEGVNYYRGWKSYDEIIQKINNSNCIIEILQEGQYGSTLRYFEAVCYNKKLLTNNPAIVDFPFYDSRYMKVFSDVEKIDVDWIKKREKIDYNYRNEFSPRRFVDILLE